MAAYFGPIGSDPRSFDEFVARYIRGQQAAQSSRSIDITRLLSRRTHDVLNAAARFAMEHGHSEVDGLHILRVMAEESPAADAIRGAGANPEAIAQAAEQGMPASHETTAEQLPSLTASARRLLIDGYQVARGFGSTYVDPEHLFLAFVLGEDSPAGAILQKAGVTPAALQAVANGEAPAQTSTEDTGSSQSPMLEKFGRDLTAEARDGRLDPVIGRHEEIEQTVEILSRRTKNNPVLIGEAGVGKTAVAEGLAQKIAADDVPVQLRGKSVVELDVAAMLSGTRYRGDFEERLTTVMDEISERSDELIVFIDELHTVVGAGGGGDGGMDAGNILKPRLARGDLHLIGATTLSEYRTIEKDAAFSRRFQPVTVGEPSIDDTVAILEGLKPAYERFHAVTYTDEAVRSAVELSARYVTDRFLPDKAIDLMDQAGARKRLAGGGVVDIDALRTQLGELEAAKGEAVESEDYESASRIRDQIAETVATIDDATASAKPTISEADIADVISRATGIPVSRVSDDDRVRLSHLEDELHERVVGQRDAVEVVARAVRRSRTGMGDERRPVGSFLFLGPTGVGKTELAKALASSLFGTDDAMVRFDMSEFGERHTVSRLVGAPPGYVGYDEAGQLTERVRRRPYSVILLDEIEKAHPDVFNLLLQVLDDGRLTDGQGRTVDFRHTVIIMTSNLGSEFLSTRNGAIGFVADGHEEVDVRARVMGRLRESMRPEFLNRIDEIVLFHKLEPEQLHEITRLLLVRTEERVAGQGLGFEIDDAAVAWIAERGYEPEYGARPLKRLIQRQVDDRIAELLVADSLSDGASISVTVHDGELIVSARHRDDVSA
ncbi:ATP-dependent Clp protease ATP-binding subunit [Microbacterium sp. MPKO10]|uniref:ATP-dependent Clp protease ATP-binding subunit n=1 Tax=Microbacterium sp. MPKO10 TaxID=2989818 RepID=UPI00223580DF|nr:ATP-dependent Clp protease ATP-binding subunit [Microbacterium sp. MPKO10]MCW4458480.1 ATP-dependent Clp protease ATP-binding subunit [Microbacterium sp. MPKO10]